MNVLPKFYDDDIQVVVSFSRPCIVFKSVVVFQNKGMSLNKNWLETQEIIPFL